MDKKKAIIDAAIELFGVQGFDNTSTQSIAKKAGIGTGTLFKYFDSKEALIKEAYQQSKYEMLRAAKLGVEATLDFQSLIRILWQNVFNWCITNPQKYRFTQQIASSRFVDPEMEAIADREMLFFKVATQAAKDNQQIVNVSLELIQLTIWSFLNLAIQTHGNSEIGTEQTIYQLMLNSLKIKS